MNARFTSKQDIEATQTDVCFVPKVDSCTAAKIKEGLARGQFRVPVC
jgi:hypothetical protein